MTPNDTERFEQRLWGELRPLLDERRAVPDGRRARALPPLQRTAALAVLTVVAVGVLTFVLARRDGGDQVFAEELDDGRVRVALDLAQYFDAPQAARQELEAAGIAVEVQRPAASPSMVGKVTNIMVDHDAAGVEVSDGVRDPDEVASATIDPEVFDGAVTLVVPRAPEPGEPLEVAGSVFFEGEPLAGLWCEQWPLTSQQFAAAAAARGLDVHWEVVTAVTPNAQRPEFSNFEYDHSAERPEGQVLFALLATNVPAQPVMPEPGSVVATVLPDDVERRPDVARMLSPESVASQCDG